MFCDLSFSVIWPYFDFILNLVEAYSEPSQTSKMELFARMVHGV